MRYTGKVHTYVIQPPVQSRVAQLHTDLFTRPERRQRHIHAPLANLDVVHRVPADALHLGNVPGVAVCARQDADVRRLPAALGK
jgi:hypothetical protein